MELSDGFQQELFGLNASASSSADEELARIERCAATYRSFLAAGGAGGADVYMFAPANIAEAAAAVEALDKAESRALSALILVPEASAQSGGHWWDDSLTTHWDDGRELHWVGGRCVITDRTA